VELDARLDALGSPRSKRRRKPRFNAGPTVLGFLLVVGILAAIYLIYVLAGGAQSGQEEPQGPAKIEVVKGDTLSSVAEKLDRAGVIDSAFMFKLEARMEGYGTEIKTGEYTFARGEDTRKILEKLTAGEAVPTLEITIPEGLTLQQTAQEVASQSDIPAAKFEEAARRTDYGYGFLENPEIKTTEGFLFPKQYEFEEDTTASQMVTRMLEQYLLETQTLDVSGAKDRLNLSEYELVTVASLIEKEAASPEERPLVASVIYNRLDKDMPLQIDATIHYALGHPKEELSLADLKIESPYNTYENTGLPPGPICSPSRQSLEAAMNPAQTDYLYYVLKANGEEHFFTSNYNEFLDAKAKAGR
jgi:peptidoglycan lytic transglycosylase G